MDADRAGAEERFRTQNGSGIQDAALAARVLYPLDDGFAPGDAFAHEAKKRSREFDTQVASLRGNEVGVAAERAIEELLELARDHREMHYVSLFERALESASGPAAAPEAGE